MKIDTAFPPPPLYNQPPLPCSDLSPARLRALDRLATFATVAESWVGSIPAPGTEAPPLPFPATTRGFALHCFAASPFVPELAELLSRSKINIIAQDHVDAPHVMLIEPRRYWGVLGPIAGDIVLFADGQAAVVLRPLCKGCQNFEGVSLDIDGPPQIVKQSHWTSTLKWIIRLVDESPAEPAPVVAEAAAPDMASADVHAAPNSEAAAAEAPAETTPPKKSRRTGQP